MAIESNGDIEGYPIFVPTQKALSYAMTASYVKKFYEQIANIA